MVRFVLVTLEAAYPANLSPITSILDFDRFEGTKKSIFHQSSRRPQIVRFELVTPRPA